MNAQTNYRTEQGWELQLGSVDRRRLDRISLKREPPKPPVRIVEAWGDIEEEIPIFDDPAYQAQMTRYHLWLAKEQSTVLSQAIVIRGEVGWSELDELAQIGIEAANRRAGLLCYLLSDDDQANVTAQILYQSTVTERGIHEAATAYAVEWLGKAVVAWRVPTIPARLSREFEARRVATAHHYTWPEFCTLTGPEQSATVCHYRLSNKLAWLEAEYERARNA